MFLKMLLTLAIAIQLTRIHAFSTIQNGSECKSLETVPDSAGHHHKSSHLYVFGGGDENLKILSTASRLNRKWEPINTMPTVKAQFCGAVSGTQIYSFGGFRGSILLTGANMTRIAKADAYDCLTDTYTMLRSMPETREGCGAATLNGVIYVAGGSIGQNNYVPVSSVLRYDILNDQWSTVRPMHRARRGHQLVEWGNQLYAIGGYNDYTVEVYNPITDHWSFVASTQNPHQHFGATVHEGKIYVLSTNGFEVYSPWTNVWYNLNPPNDNEHRYRPLVSMNDKLWTVGGEYLEDGKRTVSKSVLTYDTSTARWVKQADMDAFRTLHSAFVVHH